MNDFSITLPGLQLVGLGICFSVGAWIGWKSMDFLLGWIVIFIQAWSILKKRDRDV